MMRGAFAAVLGCAVFAAGAALAAPAAEDFGSLPAISRVHLSPDGQYFSAVEPVNGRPTVVVFKLGDPNTKPIIFADPGSFALDSMWVNNDRLLCTVYGDIKEDVNSALQYHRRTRVISVSISGKDPVVLLKKSQIFYNNRSTAYIVGLNAENPDLVYLGAYQFVSSQIDATTPMASDNALLNLYSVNIENGDVNLLEKGTQYTRQWFMDGHGNIVARVDESQDLQDSVIVYDHGSTRVATTFDASRGEGPGVNGVTVDGSALVIGRNGDRNTIGLDTFPLSGSAFGANLFSDAKYDADDSITDDWTGRVIGVRYVADKDEYRYFDPTRQKLQHQLEVALPGQSVEIASVDAKGLNIIVASNDPQHPKTYWLYNSASHQLNALATEFPSLTPADLGEMKRYPYKARDGLDIDAYLTLPPGKAPRNLPTVIFPHGGPEARDDVSFDWWAQFMVSRGYAVLQPNFRGSAGYGKAFVEAGNGQWGRKMQDDVSDGVKKLIADGIADPKRICIVGASYGGYAALAGATFTPDLYACAISYAGVSNVPGIIGNVTLETGGKSSSDAYMRIHVGDISSNEKALEDISPADHAGQVGMPVLLLHSARDNTVPIEQSVLENAALKKAGKDVQFITIDGDDHYLELASTRIRVLKEIEAFLKAHIGN